MPDSAVAITAGTGTNIDTRTEGTNGNHRQVIVIGDPSDNLGVAPVASDAGLKVNLGADNDITLATLPDTATNDLAGINTTVTSIDGKIPVLGQAVASASVPIVLTSTQLTTLTPPAAITGFATSAKQDTIIGHVDGIEGLLTTIDADTSNISTKIDTVAGAVSGTEMQVDVLTMPTVTVNSHAVTNAGTFAVQVDGAALTSLQLADDVVATLGTTTYTETSTKATVIGAIRRDADTTLVDTTNEVAPLQVDANGRLKVEAFSGETLPVSLTSTTVAGTVAVTQSGTWDEVGINDSGNSITVDNGGTFAVQVDGNALTSLQLIDDTVATTASAIPTKGQAVSGTDGTNARILKTDTSGELQIDVLSIAAGDNNIGNVDIVTVPTDPFGANADAASATGSISAKLRFIASTGIPITGTVTVGSHAVTNAGTFVVQENGSALTALQLIDNSIYVSDAGIGSATPSGNMLVGHYSSSPAKISASDDAVSLKLTQEGKILSQTETVAADTTNINNNYSSAQTNTSQQSAPGANKRIVVTQIMYSRDTAGTMKLVEDPAGTPATKFGPHYFPANGGMVAVKVYIPLTANKALGLTTTGGGNETLTAVTIIENV